MPSRYRPAFGTGCMPGIANVALSANLISSGPWRLRVVDLAVDDLDRLAEIAAVLQVGDEVGQRRQRRAAALDRQLAAVLLELREPQHLGQRLAQFVEHVHAAALALAQRFDQRDPLLQLLLLLVERRHLLKDRLQARRLALRFG